MPKYYETKSFLVRALSVAIMTVFMTVSFTTSKVFADEPGSVFLWGGYDDDGLFGTYAEEHGSPEYSTFGDAEEKIQKLKAGFEVEPDAFFDTITVDVGLFQKGVMSAAVKEGINLRAIGKN